MAIQESPTHSLDGNSEADNRLALLDQAFYAGHRAAGQKEVMQVVWMYERAVDMEGLRRFHQNLAHGLLGRRIERSPLPFGRYRWVSDPQPSPLDVAPHPRPRAEFGDWLDERAHLPLDAESGPGWRLSVLPFTDGSTAITFVMSHYVIDGVGGVVAVALAVLGDTSGQGYPRPRSRPLARALIQDLRDVVRDVPNVARAVGAAIEPLRQARHRHHDSDRRANPPTPRFNDDAGATGIPVAVPGIWIRTDMDVWEARAAALGGTGSTLATALTAKLGERMGHGAGADGSINMVLVVNDRTEGDTRAVAVSFARFRIDPTQVTSDLRGARASIKQALKTLRETPDPSARLAPLTPFTPKRAWREMVDQGFADPDQPAVCSSLGEVGPVVIRPDGTRCDYAYLRGMSQQLTQQRLDQMGSQLQLFYGCGVEANKVGIHVRAYQPGSLTTKAELRDLAERTLAEFELTGIIE